VAALDVYLGSGGNDTRRPLKPVSNYVQTPAGLWVPMLGGSSGQLSVNFLDASGNALNLPPAPTGENRLLSAANTNNATVVKASAGFLWNVRLRNAAAAIRYLKFYNKITTPAPNTDTPFAVLEIAASEVPRVNFNGMYFPTGIGFALVTGQAENDNTAVTAGDILSLCIDFA
jgi:hypothetical protein